MENIPNIKATVLSLAGIIFIFIALMLYINNYEKKTTDKFNEKHLTRNECKTEGGQWIAVSTYSAGPVDDLKYFCSH